MHCRMNSNIILELVAATAIIIFFGRTTVSGACNNVTLAEGECSGLYLVANYCDFRGSETVKDLSYSDATNPEDCWRKCLQTSGCTHFTHNYRGCIFKSAPVTELPILDAYRAKLCGRLTLQ